MSIRVSLMFPSVRGVELHVVYDHNDEMESGIEIEKITLAGEKEDFSEWFSESAMDAIEEMIVRSIESDKMRRVAIECEAA